MAPKSMVSIFHDLAANRREARAAQLQFVVLGLKKNGTPYAITAIDLQYNATRTKEEAEARQRQLETMHPGKPFCIVTR